MDPQKPPPNKFSGCWAVGPQPQAANALGLALTSATVDGDAKSRNRTTGLRKRKYQQTLVSTMVLFRGAKWVLSIHKLWFGRPARETLVGRT